MRQEVWQVMEFCGYQDEAESEQVSSVNYLPRYNTLPPKYLLPMFEKVIQTLD